MQALVEAVLPVLPFPAAAADGATPASGGAQAKWFVVWPEDPDDSGIIVKANPFHPETQKAGATAEVPIQQAIAAAERKAQAAYDRALDELRRTGRATDIDGISLDDEGIAGERIDAALELTIEVTPDLSFEMKSSQAPLVSEGPLGSAWTVSVAPNAYRDSSGDDPREHFRPAETRLFFGPVSRPAVQRVSDTPRYVITVPAVSKAFVVVIRGNEDLLKSVLAGADWTRLTRLDR